MSLESWKEEFYPTDASGNPGDIQHSLTKWKGLRHLKEHNLRKLPKSHRLVEKEYRVPAKLYIFNFSSETCSLCMEYDDCVGCPLFDEEKTISCFYDEQPYSIWVRTDDPEPMIAALEKALEGEFAKELAKEE